ncbi:beta family protein [Rummeliibacillus stabekisii]|uniref:beta family protein n=1 Tax=Rummeliibacillus stabekisii TaxID=241244 RepID=UPI00204016A5|nr:beta family protein [Rummeliibacillus stabekisii]MCM3316146.1 beta family protein [Rummeliibacillus stabekisii]
MLYVPILKWKAGEKEALANLRPEIKSQITPLIELTPDILEKGEPLKVASIWENLFYFDVSYESVLEETEFIKLVETCDAIDQIIPVVNLGDSFEKIQSLYDLTRNGIALRVSINDGLDSNFQHIIKQILSIIPPQNIDLILDAREIQNEELNQKVFLANAILDSISELDKLKSIILASSSFPNSLTNCESEKISTIDRLEPKFYFSVAQKCTLPIIFSDYAINHWSYFEFIPGIKPSFNIRYTLENSYLVYKGITVQRGGLNIENVKNGCRAIVSHPSYLGESYSWGDKEIHLKAINDSNKPGNLTTWRNIGTNHHITLTVNQLANLSLSLTSL